MIEMPPKISQNDFIKAIELLTDNSSQKLLKKINDNYLYWDKVKYQQIPEGCNVNSLWAAVKTSRRLDSSSVKFGKYSFSFNKPDYIQQILHELDLNIGGSLASEGVIAKEDKERYLISSVMEEAIASSKMEGAVTTREHAKEMLKTQAKAKSKSDQMIINNYISIRHIVDNKTEKLTPENLLEIHRLMTDKTLDNPKNEGTFRNSNDVYVVDHINSEIVHTPPDFTEIPELINDLCSFFNTTSTEFIHPIIKGIIIHFMIGYIHPFVDGNGRTARALFYWYLLSKGYWLTEYLSISRLIIKSKISYEKAYIYSEQDENDLTYFIRYNLKTMDHAYKDLKLYINKKIEEKNLALKFTTLKGINERQAMIIKMINESPSKTLSVKEIENTFLIANQTARTDLIGLVKQGFLVKVNLNQKKQTFVKSNNFENLLKEALQPTASDSPTQQNLF